MSEIAENVTPTKIPDKAYVLINAYDKMVKTAVWELMLKTDMCRCEKCFLDICAMVFNNPHHRYTHFVTTLQGELLTKVPEMNHGCRAELTVTILNAIKLVSASPKH